MSKYFITGGAGFIGSNFIQRCINKNRLKVELLDSIFWLDTGTHDALVEASSFIKTIELREGKRISCLEEIAYKYDYIDSKRLKEIIAMNNENSNYLKKILKQK